MVSLPWLDWARGELDADVREWRGDRDNPRILGYLDHCTARRFPRRDETPWCSAFVCAAFERTGYESTRDPAARSWIRWGLQVTPRVGCVVVFPRPPLPWSGHVGLLAAFAEDGRIELLGGNQRNSVSMSRRRLSDAIGFRWPYDGRLPEAKCVMP